MAKCKIFFATLFFAVFGLFIWAVIVSLKPVQIAEPMVPLADKNDAAVYSEEEWHEEYHMVYYDRIPLGSAWQNWVTTVCNVYGVEPELVYAICETESNYNKDAVDYADGTHHGLMQLGPHARSYCNAAAGKEFDYFDEFDNVEAGIIYLAGILEATPDYHKALMVYNCGGATAKEKWNNGIYSTNYSEAVMKRYYEFQKEKGVQNGKEI